MIRAATCCCLLIAAASAAPDRADLLRFTNGDQLHGAFLGIANGTQAVWRRDDIAAPVEFKTSGLRHVVLRGGAPRQALTTLSHIGLVNGDRIPGNITAMDDAALTIETGCGGTLSVPRPQVALLAPNPLGGRVHYHGPFSEAGWTMANASFPEGLPEPPKKDEKDADGKPADEKPGDADDPARWEFSGSAWYWRGGRSGTALLRGGAMTDRSVLRFELAWKNRLNLAVAFHADLAAPAPTKDEADKERRPRGGFDPGAGPDLPRVFGNSYVLQMYSSYLMLFRTGVDEDGGTTMERVQLNNNHLRLGETGKASVEIRSNRPAGTIALFVNGEFVSQWSEGDSFAGKGAAFGFLVQSDESPVRISDVVVSEWNGMPDSARSLELDDQDVVLMTNGTDRLAGKVATLEADGKIIFEGKHGRFRLPLDEVAEIRFARGRLAEPPAAADGDIQVRLDPIGAISGRPVTGDAGSLAIHSPILGPLNLSTAAVVMIEFNATNQIIDDWDADF